MQENRSKKPNDLQQSSNNLIEAKTFLTDCSSLLVINKFQEAPDIREENMYIVNHLH